MQHLRVLEKADLVIVKRQGRQRWNYINPLPIKGIYDRWISHYAVGTVDLLARMKREMGGQSPRLLAGRTPILHISVGKIFTSA